MEFLTFNLKSQFLQCMHTTWYLSVEWQLTLLAPLIIYLLWKFGYKAVTVIVALEIAASFYIIMIAYSNKFIVHEQDLYELNVFCLVDARVKCFHQQNLLFLPFTDHQL